MEVTSLADVLEEQLQDLYNAENQLIKALPKLAKKASSEGLKKALLEHLEETKTQAQRLTSIGETLGIKLTGKKCKAMEGLIEEGEEAIKTDGEASAIDVMIVAAAQRVEHYEISGYGTARAIAEQLGYDDVASLLSETLDEESAADEKLSDICQDELFDEVETDEEEDDSDDDEEESEPEPKSAR